GTGRVVGAARDLRELAEAVSFFFGKLRGFVHGTCPGVAAEYSVPPMPFRAVLVLLGALVAFFGATLLSERSAHASDNTASAPVCDDRAASAYAAEPAPQPIDAGD